MEGCKALCLQERAALKPGEQHCLYCDGHGYLPIAFDPYFTQINPHRCGHCAGTGKPHSWTTYM